MKKRYWFLLAIVIMSIFFWYRDQPEQRVPRLLAEKLDDSLHGGELLYFEDTHGGFHGDGYTIAVVRIRPSLENVFRINIARHPNWHPLPLSDSLLELMYRTFPGENDGPFDPPSPEEGWYYFYDRHSKSTDPTDDSDLFSRASFNYDLAIYDVYEGTVWFFAFDT